jgi:hypothetical protein
VTIGEGRSFLILVSIMQYDHKIDEAIIQALNDKIIIQKYALDDKKTKKKREELHFDGIFKAVEELYHIITNRDSQSPPRSIGKTENNRKRSIY